MALLKICYMLKFGVLHLVQVLHKSLHQIS